MLEELSKKDKTWRSIAYKYCGCKSQADDIVQEMYIKVLRYDKIINDSYVGRIIHSIYINSKRQGKRYNKNIDDDVLKHISNKKVVSNYTSTFALDDLSLVYLDRFNNINWKERELILESMDKSLREIAENTQGVDYQYIHRTIHSGLKKVLKEDYPRYKNSKLKYRRNG